MKRTGDNHREIAETREKFWIYQRLDFPDFPKTFPVTTQKNHREIGEIREELLDLPNIDTQFSLPPGDYSGITGRSLTRGREFCICQRLTP